MDIFFDLRHGFGMLRHNPGLPHSGAFREPPGLVAVGQVATDCTNFTDDAQGNQATFRFHPCNPRNP